MFSGCFSSRSTVCTVTNLPIDLICLSAVTVWEFRTDDRHGALICHRQRHLQLRNWQLPLYNWQLKVSTQLTGVGGGGNRLWVNDCTLPLHVSPLNTFFVNSYVHSRNKRKSTRWWWWWQTKNRTSESMPVSECVEGWLPKVVSANKPLLRFFQSRYSFGKVGEAKQIDIVLNKKQKEA